MSAMPLNDLPRAVLRHLDLRFHKQEEELLYKGSVQRKMIFAALVVNIFYMVGFIVSAPKLPDLYIDDPRALSGCTAFIGIFVVPAVVVTMAILRLRCRLLESFDWEIFIICCSSISSTAIILHPGWTTATLYGKDPNRVWGEDMRYSEGNVLLILNGMTTVMCLFIPVRICLKWITPVMTVLTFGVSGRAIGSPFPSQFNVRTFALAALTLCALCGAWENERVARRNFVAQGQVRRTSQQLERQHESSARILRSLSDALLLLTHDLQIINSDPCFAAMLFSSQPDVLTGTSFTEYLASGEDRERFTSALENAYSIADLQKTNRCGGMIHVNCRDTHGRSFGVYVYYTRSFVDSDCDQGYMVALVEAQEREAPPDLERRIYPNFMPLESSEDLAGDEDAASISSTRSGSGVHLVDRPAAELAVWVDVSSSELTIVRCSAGITLLGPIPEGTGLFSMMIGKKRHLLKPWLEERVNAIDNEDSIYDEHFELRLRITPTSSSEFTARCCIDRASPILTDQVSEGDVLARVVLSHVKCHRRQLNRRDMTLYTPASARNQCAHQAEAVHLSL